ncbi:hypothetical protein J4N42_07750 [Vibrio sp. SCSIO 43135]|uniref:hypothetical protein n=1 Tax=Vibrio sp. SCSIO 43135 TaxID=2819096 RepID=UPI00207506DD|nr:hypothetical protein [Vibrio sp. SCSIO 43135]USD39974.1 hypothetical protein J4N42_07750 [Vibrio sp. SCSIO 43135]
MGLKIACLLVLSAIIPLPVSAEVLDNKGLHTVPSDATWKVAEIKRISCEVCTADMYIQSGSVQINGVWISGNFEFSMDDETKVVLGSDAVFALGDVVNSISIESIEESAN